MLATCAQLCEASYDDAASGFTTVGDLRYGVFDTEHGTIVCIRGTANLDNWLTDARFLPARSCGGYLAHKGFVAGYRQLCSGGMPTAKGSEIIATGHSLGGALATLLAEHTGCRLVTFGSPRVYWRFGRAPKLDHTRIVRDDDPVPQVPKLLYSHRSDPLTLKDRDHHLVQVKDHFMIGYLKAMKTLPLLLLALAIGGCAYNSTTITAQGNVTCFAAVDRPTTVTTSPALTTGDNTIPATLLP